MKKCDLLKETSMIVMSEYERLLLKDTLRYVLTIHDSDILKDLHEIL